MVSSFPSCPLGQLFFLAKINIKMIKLEHLKPKDKQVAFVPFFLATLDSVGSLFFFKCLMLRYLVHLIVPPTLVFMGEPTAFLLACLGLPGRDFTIGGNRGSIPFSSHLFWSRIGRVKYA